MYIYIYIYIYIYLYTDIYIYIRIWAQASDFDAELNEELKQVEKEFEEKQKVRREEALKHERDEAQWEERFLKRQKLR